jgi:hypothetical protein
MTNHLGKSQRFWPAALVLGIFASSLTQAANVAAGSMTTTSVTVASDQNWTVVRSVNLTLPDTQRHTCVVIGSADMGFGGAPGIENRYRFVVTQDEINPLTGGGSERTVELVDNPGVDDPDTLAVSTNQTFSGVGGGLHTYRLLARKADAITSTAGVDDASLSVICVDGE